LKSRGRSFTVNDMNKHWPPKMLANRYSKYMYARRM
jgi:hypothetical protein